MSCYISSCHWACATGHAVLGWKQDLDVSLLGFKLSSVSYQLGSIGNLITLLQTGFLIQNLSDGIQC